MDKIYIVEDDENIRNLLKIALEGFGYEAQGFETAEEGLEQIAQNPPDLVIFDWSFCIIRMSFLTSISHVYLCFLPNIVSSFAINIFPPLFVLPFMYQ